MNRIDFSLLVLENARIGDGIVIYDGYEYDMRFSNDRNGLIEDIAMNHNLDNDEDLDLSLVVWIANHASVYDGEILVRDNSFDFSVESLEALERGIEYGF